MTDIYATVAVAAADVDTARTIGAPDQNNPQWAFTRACTTDTQGDPPATHYACSGQADAALLALIVASLPGVQVNYTDTGVDALTGFGLRFVVEEI